MAGADYVCCEVCGRKIVYSPEHQPEAVCKECYDTLKAKAELLDEAVEALEKIAKHAYKGIVAQTAYEALTKAKELK